MAERKKVRVLKTSQEHRANCNVTWIFLMEHLRLCKSIGDNCESCPLYCYCTDENHNNPMIYRKKINALQKWSDENPPQNKIGRTKTCKTRLDDFKEKYPEAMLHSNGLPVVCAGMLGYAKYCEMPKEIGICTACWHHPLEECENYGK